MDKMLLQGNSSLVKETIKKLEDNLSSEVGGAMKLKILKSAIVQNKLSNISENEEITLYFSDFI